MSSEDAAVLTLCVADANILIDLEDGGVLRFLFDLPYRFIIPDAILGELERPSPDALRGLAFEAGNLDGESVQEVFVLRPRYPQLSVNDLFALFLARDRGAMLLTGDHRLRQLAQEYAVLVHGTLWALDEMVRAEVLSPARACQALEAMLARGARLPATECQKRRARWQP